MNKKVLLIFPFIIIVGLGYILINNYYIQNSIVNLECRGSIENIKRNENHGAYYFFINGEWPYFGTYGDYIHHFGVIGDSLIKEKGKEEVTLYRRNYEGMFEEYKTIRLSIYPLQSLE